ncbi:shikimate kinase [Ruminococcus sp.]|uniref:shikimate kinase n=1 Tax=Ruminococcus sp. TaxID=41978 RepID=UPI0025D2F787|nr:shikimate kinase [Ruminococcus sp.]MBQ8965080.1 shikimate kinase [Ruminococcus sp.]
MTPIFLCGFMGCGKSTVGRILARRLRCKCIDLDDYIEKKEGMSIPEIFEKKGEAYFRERETEALAAFRDIGGVVATGGGALLSDINGKTAMEAGMVVFIDTDFNTCYGRIKDDPHRPIAASSTREQLKQRFDDRSPRYRAHSHYAIPGGYPPLVIAVKIERIYKKFTKDPEE